MKKSFDIHKLLRKNIRNIKPYSSARIEFSGKAEVFLDANENSFGATGHFPESFRVNRYPDPLQKEIREKISKIKKVSPSAIFLGNGSDEPIDLLFRAFCEPSRDAALIFPPTYGMYKVAAEINDVKTIEVPLSEDFQIDFSAAKKHLGNKNLKLVFVCSPNNPTGNRMSKNTLEKIIKNFNGIVVLDEAYIDFCQENSLLSAINNYPNLVILQTFSKAWGMAGARLGTAFASEEIVDVLNKIKAPYNINIFTQRFMAESLKNESRKNNFVKKIIARKNILAKQLSQLKIVEKLFPSDANFLLVKFTDAGHVFKFLKRHGVIVRDRSGEINCENCLRITVGTETENRKLIQYLKEIQ